MDQLAKKTQKAKVLLVKLQYANKHIHNLEYEKTVVKSRVSEINQYLQRLVETRDSVFTVSVRKHLLDKFQPVFSMLNQIKGVSGSGSLSKQRGEAKGEPNAKQTTGEHEHEHKPKANDQKSNEASTSNKGKEKLIDEDDEEEE